MCRNASRFVLDLEGVQLHTGPLVRQPRGSHPLTLPVCGLIRKAEGSGLHSKRRQSASAYAPQPCGSSVTFHSPA